jgi:hypothetical protein
MAILNFAAPNIVGGTGGSGTRLVARIIRQGGMFIGTCLNESEDAVIFGDYSDQWINRYLKYGFNQLCNPEPMMAVSLEKVVKSHLASLSPNCASWGWKEPRSIFLIPFFAKFFGSMKFLHIVRDGRDMAFSSNQNQLIKHGAGMIPERIGKLNSPLRSMYLWNHLNLSAAEYGERNLTRRYLRVRFEDLCYNPIVTIGEIFDFFGLAGPVTDIANDEVKPPESLGRWRLQEQALIRELEQIGRAALIKFGYHIVGELQ